MTKNSAQESDPLARTKPLADPLRFLGNLFFVLAALAFMIAILVALATSSPALFMQGLAGALNCGGVAFLISPDGKPNAIYLRAFRTDEATVALRAQLSAALGPQYRLAGIRPPRRRFSAVVRFLAPGLMALNYAGGGFMELEAGEDWMARLWKTYLSVRVVFVDLRALTEHVHREIQMTLETMGTERCTFIVSPKRSEAEWRSLVAEIAGPGVDLAALHLLEVSEEAMRQGAITRKVKAFEKQLPPGYPDLTESGYDFVVANVSPKELKMGRRIRAADVAGAAIGLAILAGIYWVIFVSNGGESMGSIDPSVMQLALIMITVPWLPVLLFIVASAMRDLRTRARRLEEAGHAKGGEAARGVFWLVALLFGFSALLLIASVWIQISAISAGSGPS